MKISCYILMFFLLVVTLLLRKEDLLQCSNVFVYEFYVYPFSTVKEIKDKALDQLNTILSSLPRNETYTMQVYLYLQDDVNSDCKYDFTNDYENIELLLTFKSYKPRSSNSRMTLACRNAEKSINPLFVKNRNSINLFFDDLVVAFILNENREIHFINCELQAIISKTTKAFEISGSNVSGTCNFSVEDADVVTIDSTTFIYGRHLFDIVDCEHFLVSGCLFGKDTSSFFQINSVYNVKFSNLRFESSNQLQITTQHAPHVYFDNINIAKLLNVVLSIKHTYRLILNNLNVTNIYSFSSSQNLIDTRDIRKIRIRNCNFNTVQNVNSVIYAAFNNNFEMVSSTLLNNKVTESPVILHSNFNGEVTEVSILNCNFIGNDGFDSGGINIRNNRSLVEIMGNHFESNNAKKNGGALIIYSENMLNFILLRNHFVRNKASQNGGACYFNFNYCTNSTSAHNIFAYNEANKGGGLYISILSGNTFSFDGLLEENQATAGGGMFFEHSEVLLFGKINHFDKNNKALEYGDNLASSVKNALISTVEHSSYYPGEKIYFTIERMNDYFGNPIQNLTEKIAFSLQSHDILFLGECHNIYCIGYFALSDKKKKEISERARLFIIFEDYIPFLDFSVDYTCGLGQRLSFKILDEVKNIRGFVCVDSLSSFHIELILSLSCGFGGVFFTLICCTCLFCYHRKLSKKRKANLQNEDNEQTPLMQNKQQSPQNTLVEEQKGNLNDNLGQTTLIDNNTNHNNLTISSGTIDHMEGFLKKHDCTNLHLISSDANQSVSIQNKQQSPQNTLVEEQEGNLNDNLGQTTLIDNNTNHNNSTSSSGTIDTMEGFLEEHDCKNLHLISRNANQSVRIYSCNFRGSKHVVKCFNTKIAGNLQQFDNERKIPPKHSNIIQVIDCLPKKLITDDIEYVGIVMKNYKCDLKQLIKTMINNGGCFKNELVKAFLKQTSSALKCLEEKKILHLDIKPENILVEVDKNGKVCKFVLSDFGFSVEEDKIIDALVGTPKYECPEKELTYKSDIFALGCVLYEILSLDIDTDLSKKIREGNRIENLIETKIEKNVYSDKIIQTLKNMLQTDPKKRDYRVKKSLTDAIVDYIT
ncbi:hypothetical protein ABK040_008321 [Willaertia magna]